MRIKTVGCGIAIAVLFGLAQASLASTTFNGATINVGSMGQFTGPGAGNGIDFTGTFLYAVDIGNFNTANDHIVSGVTFTSEPDTPNFTAAGTIADPWATAPNYSAGGGTTTDQANLSTVMNGIRYGNNVALTAAVTAGHTYTMQLLFEENYYSDTGHRLYDINMTGDSATGGANEVLVTHLDPDATQGDPRTGPPTIGTNYTYNFTASSSSIGITLPDETAPDQNAIINGFLLKDVTTPEPASAAFIGIAGAALLLRRKSHR